MKKATYSRIDFEICKAYNMRDIAFRRYLDGQLSKAEYDAYNAECECIAQKAEHDRDSIIRIQAMLDEIYGPICVKEYRECDVSESIYNLMLMYDLSLERYIIRQFASTSALFLPKGFIRLLNSRSAKVNARQNNPGFINALLAYWSASSRGCK